MICLGEDPNGTCNVAHIVAPGLFELVARPVALSSGKQKARDFPAAIAAITCFACATKPNPAGAPALYCRPLRIWVQRGAALVLSGWPSSDAGYRRVAGWFHHRASADNLQTHTLICH
jgi:hypothetical protein